ncbi:MAG: nicotinate-nucleotide--dimethylbenzimidazole phosphoribosyltransferase [Candidatus Omnitrophica bacterium]|nr:nicotinate-nucleotide--dimethylbenzimidazole phosphoribosyltransferase [Candidatus Omnitrophota bacterium]
MNFQEAVNKIQDIDAEFIKMAQRRLDNLTKPQGSLGRLEELARQICGIKGRELPDIKKKSVFVLAADHGVTEEGVSAFPKEVTAQMVYNFLNGGAGINVLARHVGAEVVVVDMGVAEKVNPSTALRVNGEQCRTMKSAKRKAQNFVDKKINYGTKNMAKGPAMGIDEVKKCLDYGVELVESESRGGVDIVAVGDMGIGNTTSSSAIVSVITRSSVESVTGRGTGVNDTIHRRKIEVIKQAIALNKPDPEDGLDVLSKVGGFEIGGIAGIILGCAALKIPVVIDGFNCGASALIAYTINPKSKQYMIAGHCSVEPGHRIALDHIGLKPLFDLDLRLGEGTGAALGIGLCEAAVKILREMATFKDANVSERDK